jgi:hypothetical protein
MTIVGTLFICLAHIFRAAATAWLLVNGAASATVQFSASAKATLSRHRILRFPFLDQLHDIANDPKALPKAKGHGGRHTDGAVNPGKIIPGKRRCRSRQPCAFGRMVL